MSHKDAVEINDLILDRKRTDAMLRRVAQTEALDFGECTHVAESETRRIPHISLQDMHARIVALETRMALLESIIST